MTYWNAKIRALLAEFVSDLEALHADGGEIDALTEKWRSRTRWEDEVDRRAAE